MPQVLNPFLYHPFLGLGEFPFLNITRVMVYKGHSEISILEAPLFLPKKIILAAPWWPLFQNFTILNCNEAGLVFPVLALWGNKNGLPSRKVKGMEIFGSKRGSTGCKWSSLNVSGTETNQSRARPSIKMRQTIKQCLTFFLKIV